MNGKYRIAAAVLLGGRSRRMGRPKENVILEGDGRTFLEKICDEIDACPEGLLSGRYLSVRRGQKAEREGYLTVEDRYPDIGPLGGITALLEAGRRDGIDAVLMLACDMIRYPEEEIERICKAYRGEDILWARTGGKDLQPLSSIYSVKLLERAVTRAESGRYKLRELAGGEVRTGFYDSDSPEAYENVNRLYIRNSN